MADEIRNQPHQSIEDSSDEVVGIHEHAQHLMEVDEEDYSDEVDENYIEEDEELDYEYYEDEFEDEGEDEEEEEEEEGASMNEDSEDGVETASCGGGEENEGGGGLNRGEIDGLFCPICMEPWTNGGDHQVCCLPCGHIYGLSCIKKCIQRNRSSRKCPQCNQKCALKDVRVLYASRIVVADEELQKKVLSLEAKCASLKKKNAKYRNELLKRQNNEADLILQLNRVREDAMTQMQASQLGATTESGEEVAPKHLDFMTQVLDPQSRRLRGYGSMPRLKAIGGNRATGSRSSSQDRENDEVIAILKEQVAATNAIVAAHQAVFSQLQQLVPGFQYQQPMFPPGAISNQTPGSSQDPPTTT